MNHKSSKLEIKVEENLRQNNVSFKREVSFSDLNGCGNTPLRFDFVIYKNNKIFCIIETDGEQHFKLNSYFNKTEEDLKETQKRDNIKTQYCKDNNINLLRISYWEFKNIENILNKTFNL